MGNTKALKDVERWDTFEASFPGPSEGNPFTDVVFTAVFRHALKEVRVEGFYDGDGTYRVRFMPDELGRWSFVTESSAPELTGHTGSFHCSEPGPDNHGPVRVDRATHFSYADGEPMFVMGTTAYAWTYRPEEVRRKSLESFSKHGFNKIRMVVFPKHYGDGKYVDISYEPPVLPFEGTGNNFDFSRPNPEYFRNYEQRVLDLARLGIEADVILFHVYDFGQWGIDSGMSPEDEFHYLRYLIARLAAYRNVWWSLGNEYDLFVEPEMRDKAIASEHGKDWKRIGAFIADHDPYGHLISAHNLPFGYVFPNTPWLTHVSYQYPNTYSLLLELKREYGKPVINDEYQYEGNVPNDWGNASPELEVYRHWLSAMAGGYATHGEAYIIDGNGKDIFWSYGGEMTGKSPPRLRYLRSVMEDLPFQEMKPDLTRSDGRDLFCLRQEHELYLFLVTRDRKDKGRLFIGPPDGLDMQFELTVHDAWEMKVVETRLVKGGINSLELPDLAVVVARRRS